MKTMLRLIQPALISFLSFFFGPEFVFRSPPHSSGNRIKAVYISDPWLREIVIFPFASACSNTHLHTYRNVAVRASCIILMRFKVQRTPSRQKSVTHWTFSLTQTRVRSWHLILSTVTTTTLTQLERNCINITNKGAEFFFQFSRHYSLFLASKCPFT